MVSLAITVKLIGYYNPHFTTKYYQTKICYTFTNNGNKIFKKFAWLFYIYYVNIQSTMEAYGFEHAV